MSDPNQVPAPTGPTMSTAATLSGIFFEPGEVFTSLRERPRFLVAGIILMLLTVIISVTLFQRVDMDQYVRTKVETSSRAAQQTQQQKDIGVMIGKFIWKALAIFVPIAVAAGAALYLVGVLAFGGSISYKKALAVWIYSSLPPAVLGTLIAVLVLFLKASDQIDPEHLLITNPGGLLGPGASKPLVVLLSQFDLLKFYGLFLAALGLSKLAKLSSGSAWAIVIGFWVIFAVLQLVGSLFS